jgi:hypothetical protein
VLFVLFPPTLDLEFELLAVDESSSLTWTLASVLVVLLLIVTSIASSLSCSWSLKEEVLGGVILLVLVWLGLAWLGLERKLKLARNFWI